MDDTTLEMTMLLDFFGETLTERQRSCCELYYNDDLSLSEIAELEGITKQGARDLIRRASASLRELEERTGLVARELHRRQEMQELAELLQQLIAGTDGQARALAEAAAARLHSMDLEREHGI